MLNCIFITIVGLLVLSDNPCFNSQSFIACVEEMTRISHVVDLLGVVINDEECKYVFMKSVSIISVSAAIFGSISVGINHLNLTVIKNNRN